ncbi:MAG: RNA polymerase subunit sigma [Deltaproteobacteria bacterium]|nr:RNA polymerase subunit sigma [Deltaproteobacteria bacterium]
MLTEMETLVFNAKPNAAHYALAELEQISHFSSVITQNVDNLHQEAGSSIVIEFHGNGKRLRCLSCGSTVGKSQVDFSIMPPRCACGGLLKPDVVFFGEAIPAEAYEKAQREARYCDLILVIGTSAVVSPASEIPLEAKRGGALVAEINLEETVLTRSVSDLSIHESAGKALPALVESIRSGM